MHYLCTATSVHESSIEHLCTNGRPIAVRLCANSWQIFRSSVSCPLVHKQLTDIAEQKGKENSMKKRKRTLKKNARNYHRLKTIHWTANGRLTDALQQKLLRGQIYIRLLSEHWLTVCCLFPVRIFLLRT